MTGLLQVDVTGVALTGLRVQLPASRFVTETPSDLTQAAVNGLVRVTRSGGGDDGIAIDTATLTLDCFSVGTEASRQFGYAVVGAMYALRGLVINNAVVTFVRKIGGPVPLSYDSPDVRRQALTFRLAVKAQP